MHLAFEDPHRAVGIGLTILIHLVFLWALISSLAIRPAQRVSGNLQVTLIDGLGSGQNVPVPPVPDLEVPLPLIAPPEVAIELDSSPRAAIGGEVLTDRLGPRLDPNLLNEPPPLPATLKSVAAKAVILRLFITENGTVGDAQVDISSGVAELDEAAKTFVQYYWRYLPALRNGRVVGDWMTVTVRFKQA